MLTEKREQLHSKEADCREIVQEDPSLSVNEIARLLNAKYRGHGLPKENIKRIRQQVREAIERAASPVELVRLRREVTELAPSPEPFNPPHFSEPKEHPARQQSPRPSTHGERRAWLDDWLLQRVFLGGKVTVQEARDAIKLQFGITLGTDEIAETIRVLRSITVDMVPKQQPSVIADTVKRIVAEMRQAGIVSVSIGSDGKPTFKLL